MYSRFSSIAGAAPGGAPVCRTLRFPVIRSKTMASANLRVIEGISMDKDRSKALDAALSQIERAFGKGSIMKLGKNDKSMEIEIVSTGSLGLDIALGIGGLPRGRVVEIYGPESSGKTTLALHTRRRGPEEGRHLRLHRRRACARPDLRAQARRQRRRSADLAAGHRRAGARDRRHAGALRRGRRAGDRFRSRRWCRAPNSKARWATASPGCRRA